MTFYFALKFNNSDELPSNLINKQAPKMELTHLSGKKLPKNRDLTSPGIKLVNFWASWCAPCRRENPNIVDAYRKFNKERFKNGSGFEIYSLSLDSKQKAWVKAINKDQLFWEYHVSDLGGWQSEGSSKYGISSIPSNVLIDSNGIIIAKDLKGPALHRFLESQKK